MPGKPRRGQCREQNDGEDGDTDGHGWMAPHQPAHTPAARAKRMSGRDGVGHDPPR